MHMNKIKLTLVGTKPLLMHNPRLSDPLDEYVVAIKKITKKRTMTDADHEEKSRLEFVGGLYHAEDIGPYVPSTWLRASLINAGKITKQGTDVQRALLVDTSEADLIYRGPRGVKELWEDKNFQYRTTVRSPGRVPRTRPKFRDWQAEFVLWYDETILNRDTLVDIAERAGTLIGIGDGRSLGSFGRFTVQVEDVAA